jgi:hypothetical protein
VMICAFVAALMESNSNQFALIKVPVFEELLRLVKGNISGMASKPATAADKADS